jgi:hypothetical protein
MFLKKIAISSFLNSFSFLENNGDLSFVFFLAWMTVLAAFFLYQLKYKPEQGENA